MSQYGGQGTNPDTRQLPPGWITQFDANYNAWFYVNTLVQPPVTTWVHPLGAPPSPAPPPPAAYSPPPGGPPPQNSGYFPPQQQGSPYPGAASPYPGAASPYPPQGGYSPGYQQPPPGQYSPYNQPPPQQYQGPPPQEGGKGLLSGMFGHHQQQPVQQPVYIAEAAPPKKHGMGLGTGLALGAGGLVGGALLAEAFDGHDGGDDGGHRWGGDDGGGDDGGRWGGDDGGGDDGGGWGGDDGGD